MNTNFTRNGYSIKPEIVDVLLKETPEISEKDIQSAGGGLVALVLHVKDKRRINLRALSRDLGTNDSTALRVVAVSMPARKGQAHWAVLPVQALRRLTADLALTRQQLVLESTLRRSG
ncbi:hypothetical protein [Streptomyces sp. NPDC048489]|uniref:hypothetical protein n=1 Tax=Streptomyces sp. NPDC048489 TaxID=3154504 RepID=UPI00341615A9